MSPELVAAIAADERTIADRLGSYGVPDAEDAAANLVRWLVGRGWRKRLEVVDTPAPARRASPEVQQAAMAQIREVLGGKR